MALIITPIYKIKSIGLVPYGYGGMQVETYSVECISPEGIKSILNEFSENDSSSMWKDSLVPTIEPACDKNGYIHNIERNIKFEDRPSFYIMGNEHEYASIWDSGEIYMDDSFIVGSFWESLTSNELEDEMKDSGEWCQHRLVLYFDYNKDPHKFKMYMLDVDHSDVEIKITEETNYPYVVIVPSNSDYKEWVAIPVKDSHGNWGYKTFDNVEYVNSENGIINIEWKEDEYSEETVESYFNTKTGELTGPDTEEFNLDEHFSGDF